MWIWRASFWLAFSSLVTTARSRQSPHAMRCGPISHTSPGRATGFAGASGIFSSDSAAASGSSSLASSSSTSSSEKPMSDGSTPSSSRSVSSAASTSSSHPAFWASLLSAMMYARRWVSDK